LLSAVKAATTEPRLVILHPLLGVEARLMTMNPPTACDWHLSGAAPRGRRHRSVGQLDAKRYRYSSGYGL